MSPWWALDQNELIEVEPRAGYRPTRGPRARSPTRCPGTASDVIVGLEATSSSGLHLVLTGGRCTYNIAKPLQASILVILLAALL